MGILVPLRGPDAIINGFLEIGGPPDVPLKVKNSQEAAPRPPRGLLRPTSSNWLFQIPIF